MAHALVPGTVPEWTLADRLRKAREHAGLKQTELAALTGISRASIVNYESGRSVPSRPVMLSWAFTCGVDLAWLAGDPSIGGVKYSVSCAPAFAMAS